MHIHAHITLWYEDFAEENEAPNSWYWSFRLAAKHGYIDLSNNTEILHACDYDPPQDYLVGGDAINGTDDGGMDDLTATDFPYSPIPPGQQFDTPFKLNQTQQAIIRQWKEEEDIAVTTTTNQDTIIDNNLDTTKSSGFSYESYYILSFVYTSVIALSSFMLGLLVQRYMMTLAKEETLTSLSTSVMPSSAFSSLSVSNFPSSTMLATRGSYQQISDDNNDHIIAL